MIRAYTFLAGLGCVLRLWQEMVGKTPRNIARRIVSSMAWGSVLFCLQGCSVGSRMHQKNHLIAESFIPLHTAPSLTSQEQKQRSTCIPREYRAQRHRLEQEQKAMGPFAPIFRKKLT